MNTNNPFQLIEDEEDFCQKMTATVEVYLSERKREGYFESFDGLKLHYNIYTADSPSAAVLMIHGFSEFTEKFNEMIYYFLNKGYNVYQPELRGHGYSERQVDDLSMVHVDSFDDYVSDIKIFVKNYLSDNKLPIFLFGHSMGGAISALLAEKFPGFFNAVILSSPMIRMRTGGIPVGIVKLIAGMNVLFKKGKTYVYGQKTFPGTRDFEHSSCLSEARYNYGFGKRCKHKEYQTWSASFSWCLASLKSSKEIMKHAADITYKTLVLYSGKDHLVKPEYTVSFCEKVKDCKTVFFENAKHESFNSDLFSRKTFYETVFQFMEENTWAEEA